MLYPPAITIHEQSVSLKLDCDTEQYGLGAVLSHICQDKTEKPIAYESRTLNENELYYSLINKEGISVILGLKKFSQYLLGNRFNLTTNNKAV